MAKSSSELSNLYQTLNKDTQRHNKIRDNFYTRIAAEIVEDIKNPNSYLANTMKQSASAGLSGHVIVMSKNPCRLCEYLWGQKYITFHPAEWFTSFPKGTGIHATYYGYDTTKDECDIISEKIKNEIKDIGFRVEKCRLAYTRELARRCIVLPIYWDNTGK
jgi:hypothetical protein